MVGGVGMGRELDLAEHDVEVDGWVGRGAGAERCCRGWRQVRW